MSSVLQNRLIEKVKHYVDMANTHLSINMKVPNIRFDKRGTVAGTATYATHTVNYNADLYVRNVEDFLINTVPHEVAHLAAHAYHRARGGFGRVQSHGDTWKMVMRTLGCVPRRCHTYDTSETKIKRNVTTYTYHCKCRNHELTARKHNGVLAGRDRICRTCRGVLKFGPLGTTTTPKTLAMPAFMIPTTPQPRVHVQQPAAKLPKIGSKKERAERLYIEYSSKGREMIIAMFMQELDMTKAGASTYYANCKKALG